ncbi:MAG: hypothetical protein FJ087_02500 [Deltaproteobacteria bacterium]|nr:hypothetical protein [Deltaproteobacteria bacterium]
MRRLEPAAFRTRYGPAAVVAAEFLQLLPRRLAVRIVSGETGTMYGAGGDGR